MNPSYAAMKKDIYVCQTNVAFFNEINPSGIWEMGFACEMWLRYVKCLLIMGGFVSFHFLHSRKFHNDSKVIISLSNFNNSQTIPKHFRKLPGLECGHNLNPKENEYER